MTLALFGCTLPSISIAPLNLHLIESNLKSWYMTRRMSVTLNLLLSQFQFAGWRNAKWEMGSCFLCLIELVLIQFILLTAAWLPHDVICGMKWVALTREFCRIAPLYSGRGAIVLGLEWEFCNSFFRSCRTKAIVTKFSPVKSTVSVCHTYCSLFSRSKKVNYEAFNWCRAVNNFLFWVDPKLAHKFWAYSASFKSSFSTFWLPVSTRLVTQLLARIFYKI